MCTLRYGLRTGGSTLFSTFGFVVLGIPHGLVGLVSASLCNFHLVDLVRLAMALSGVTKYGKSEGNLVGCLDRRKA
jgi:hypothetical protein